MGNIRENVFKDLVVLEQPVLLVDVILLDIFQVWLIDVLTNFFVNPINQRGLISLSLICWGDTRFFVHYGPLVMNQIQIFQK